MAASSSIAKIALQCMLASPDDPDRNPNCDCLLSGGGPDLNTDISGIGVRTSFYLQVLSLTLLSVRSCSAKEIRQALYTLITTNIAMILTALILGLKPSPEISFHDAIVVFYLLSLSWVCATLTTFTMPVHSTIKRHDLMLDYLSIIQSYFFFAFVLVIIIKAPTLGMTPLCNEHAQLVFIRPVNVLQAGRIALSIALSTIAITYTTCVCGGYDLQNKKWWKDCKKCVWLPRLFCHNKHKGATRDVATGLGEAELQSSSTQAACSHASNLLAKVHEKPVKIGGLATCGGHLYGSSHIPRHDTGISGQIIFKLFVCLALWSLAVWNTELLIKYNRFGGGRSKSTWQFGQILPLLLTVLPLVNQTKAFIKYKLNKPRVSHRAYKRITRAYRSFRAGGLNLNTLHSNSMPVHLTRNREAVMPTAHIFDYSLRVERICSGDVHTCSFPKGYIEDMKFAPDKFRVSGELVLLSSDSAFVFTARTNHFVLFVGTTFSAPNTRALQRV